MELKLDTGTIFGARYHTVGPVLGWDELELWDRMVQWNVDTFGASPRESMFEPGGRWYANNAKFWFRNEQDLLLFLLRWNNGS